MSEPLPPGWEKKTTDSGKVFLVFFFQFFLYRCFAVTDKIGVLRGLQYKNHPLEPTKDKATNIQPTKTIQHA